MYKKLLVLIIVFFGIKSGYYFLSDNGDEFQMKSWSGDGHPWEEVTSSDFDSEVLGSSLPVLVRFDTAEKCRGGDVVDYSYKEKWGNIIKTVNFKVSNGRSLASYYGVKSKVTYALFKNGKMIRKITAENLLKPYLDNPNFRSPNKLNEIYFSGLEEFVSF